MSEATDDLVLLREYLDEVEAMGDAGNLYHPAAKRCADLIERQAREIAELRADKDAYHYERAERAEAECEKLRADAERYRWLLQYLAIARDDQFSWTCWLGLAEIPFRFDPKQSDPTSLLDALMERHPIDAARAKVPIAGT